MHIDPAPPPPRFRPSFDSLLAQQIARRRETGLPDLNLIDSEAVQSEHQKILDKRAAHAVKVFTAQQRELANIRALAFEEGAAYARKSSAVDALYWVCGGTLLGGSLTWWLLRLGGSVAAGA